MLGHQYFIQYNIKNRVGALSVWVPSSSCGVGPGYQSGLELGEVRKCALECVRELKICLSNFPGKCV